MRSLLLFLFIVSQTIGCRPGPVGTPIFATLNNVWSGTMSGLSSGNTVVVACVSNSSINSRPIYLTQTAWLPTTGTQRFSVFYGIAQTTTFNWIITLAGQSLCVAQAYSGVHFSGLYGVGNTPIEWSGFAVTFGAAQGTGLGVPTNSGSSYVQANATTDQTLAIGLANFPGYVAGSSTSPFVIPNTTTVATYSATLLFNTLY